MTTNATARDRKAAHMHRAGDKRAPEAKTGLHDMMREAGRGARNLVDAASNELENSADSVTAAIREKPLQSSAIALGLGVLLGMFFRRH